MDRVDRKTPEELKSKFKREALSTRVKLSTLQILKSEAKSAKTSLSDLAAGVLDEYAEWLSKKRKQQGRTK